MPNCYSKIRLADETLVCEIDHNNSIKYTIIHTATVAMLLQPTSKSGTIKERWITGKVTWND